MKSFLLSALAGRYAQQPVQSLAADHPHAWLVWEPGAWAVPREAGQTTMVAELRGSEPAGTGEALALALLPRRGATQVTFGRAETCDVWVNDATLSGLHLAFMATPPDAWTVRDAGSTNGTRLEGERLAQGRPRLLAPGARLQAGQVHLSYYDAPLLHARLQLAAAGRGQAAAGA